MPEKTKKYSVFIHEPATEMLIEHVRFLAHANEAAVRRLVSALKIKAKALEAMPERCHWLYHPLIQEHKYRKLTFETHYMLIFQITGESVHVDAMVDCRQEYIWLL